MNNIEKDNDEIIENKESMKDKTADEAPKNNSDLNNDENIEKEDHRLKSKSTEIAGAIDKKESLIALGIKELKKTFFSATNSSDTGKVEKQIKGQISELDELFEANLGEKRAPIFEE